ncbi:hypothetical protein LSM04_006919 [Trypanosoma melophagium]|uniref:uncharacterized protein n=1 Tax=Trypanosoma melophagium TaxID=715481 RepID=UPI00351A7F93|nr:hypothetical protein LSM04_002280 [Trypanosoma melophagium]KAH9601507.1 hypothetical protein LSM04_003045 [Trypanosoma melophagium]KAH9601742.1 hypothetical protein LSM04_006919 [Trypanosoma melophagium]
MTEFPDAVWRDGTDTCRDKLELHFSLRADMRLNGLALALHTLWCSKGHDTCAIVSYVLLVLCVRLHVLCVMLCVEGALAMERLNKRTCREPSWCAPRLQGH